MRSRWIAAAAAVLALSGCVGIPTSGGVVTGEIIGDLADPDVVVLPSEPRPGSSQEEILADFMLAMRGPQSGYAIARQYLAESIADTWNPDESALIRTGIPSTTTGPGPNTLLYTVTSRAVVNADGIYTETEPAAQTLEYGFVQEDGEWRISSAPDGIVLSQTSFDVVFTEQALYYFDPTYRYLVPDVRWFPARATVTSRIVRELIDGPAPWLQGGVVVSAFPVATTVEGSEVSSGSATVELSSEALTAAPLDRDRMRQQLAASLDVGSVVMTVGGIVLDVPTNAPTAVRNPSVDPALLVGTPDAFGFASGGEVVELPGLSDTVVAAGATSAVLSGDKQVVAMLTPAGVQVARAGDADSALLDPRPGLVPPALDPFRFVWSAQSSSAGSLRVFEIDGSERTIASSLPPDAGIVSMSVSRDGTRLLVLLETTAGPRLVVAGIIRQDNVPVELGPALELLAGTGTPVDAAWVSDRVVATVSTVAGTAPVSLVEIGGPVSSLSQVDDAVGITGGNGGADGVRVLAPDGSVWQPRGSAGWVDTGIVVSFLGTRQ